MKNNEKLYVVHWSEATNDFFIIPNTEQVPNELRHIIYPVKTFNTLEEAETFIAYPMNPDNKRMLLERVDACRNNEKNYVFSNYITNTTGYKERLTNSLAEIFGKSITSPHAYEYRDMIEKYVKMKFDGSGFIITDYMAVSRELDHMFYMIDRASLVDGMNDTQFAYYYSILLLNCYACGMEDKAKLLAEDFIWGKGMDVFFRLNLSDEEEEEEDKFFDVDEPFAEERKPSIADAVDVIHEAFNGENTTPEDAYDTLSEALGTEAADKLMEIIGEDSVESNDAVIEEDPEPSDEVVEEESDKKEEYAYMERLPEIEKNIILKPVEDLDPREMRVVVAKFKTSKKDVEKVATIFRISPEKVKAIVDHWNTKYSIEERNAKLIELWNSGASNSEIKDECNIINDAELKKICKELGLERKPTRPITVIPIDLTKPEYQKAIELYKTGMTYPEIRKETGLTQHYLNKVFDEAIKQGLIEKRIKEKKVRDFGKTHTLTEIARITNQSIEAVKMYCSSRNIKMTAQGRGFVISDDDFTAVVSGICVE